ncbi:PAS domain S-box protein [Paenibacillus protaetiae]|uniref:PAS domain S-box protein n=1 Tax=Paenibacillus protaetiae TaxID=2509456 RepID=A0A4P6EYC7_9BACL|nr:PAS domain S-box protein [Paenibacillus protaetiae]QAY68084.1 PAS domain S-box protein [Paenibacillus protaetiae]
MMQNVFYLMKEPMLITEFEHNRWYIRDINPSFTSLSGYKKQELLEADPSGLFKEGASFGQMVARLTDENEPFAAMDEELNARSATAIPVRVTGRMFPLEEKNGCIIMCQDITVQKWIEEYAVKQPISAAAQLDEQYRIRSLERYYTPVIHTANYYLGRPAFEFIEEDSRKSVKRMLDYAKNNGTVERVELRLQIDGKSQHASIIVKPMFNGCRTFTGFSVIIASLHLNEQEDDPGYKLRMLMLNKNITATSLAQSTLISLTTISKIRNGKIKKPQRLTAELIAGELGVKPESIWSSFKR